LAYIRMGPEDDPKKAKLSKGTCPKNRQ